MNKKYLVVASVFILVVITVFAFNFPVEKSNAKGFSNGEKKNGQLSEVIKIIENEIKKNDVVRSITAKKKDSVTIENSIIIETSINYSVKSNADTQKADKIITKIIKAKKQLSDYKSFRVQVNSANGNVLSGAVFVN
ncbi:hypothetical protein [Virgibacillus ihumii]|uniref:hypothetical protein n=1 Tax=Virgibacillus ihumii TaxID=2686091 RepID=UPI00157D5A4E|nr:hypothetical protein [Virgibacillus ihumii]